MRWFQVISCDNTVRTPFVGTEGDLEGFEDFAFLSCTKIDGWKGRGWTKATSPESDGEPDDVLQTCFPLPIFSGRLRAALTASGMAEFQYLPIKVFRLDGSELSEFCIANVLSCADALDTSRSEYSRFPEDYFIERRRGQIRAIKKAVLKGSIVRGRNVLRLSQYRPPMYVSEPFVQLFQEGRFTGYSFNEVEVSD